MGKALDRYWKHICIVAVALAVGPPLYMMGLVQVFRDRIEKLPYLGEIFDLIPHWLKERLFTDFGWAIAIVAIAILLLTLSELPVTKWLIAYWFPVAPEFLDQAIEIAGADPLDAKASGEPFFGRDGELQFLRKFAGAPAQFSWTSIFGESGVGTSRLAIEWLRKLSGRTDRKWDCGLISDSQGTSHESRLQSIGSWAPRRNTAVVIDRIVDRKHLLRILAALAVVATKAKFKIRVLVIDNLDAAEIPMALEGTPESSLALLREGQRGDAYGTFPGAIHLGALNKSEWTRLAEHSGYDSEYAAEQYETSAGLPLFAKLGPTPRLKIAESADRRLAHAEARMGEDGAKILYLAALAGPLSSEARKRLAPSGKRSNLQAIFPGSKLADLYVAIPPVQPKFVAREILLRGFARIANQQADVRAICAVAFEENCEAACLSIGSLCIGPEAQAVKLLKDGNRAGAGSLFEQLGLLPEWAPRYAEAIEALNQERRSSWLAQTERLASSVSNEIIELGFARVSSAINSVDNIPLNAEVAEARAASSVARRAFDRWRHLNVLSAGVGSARISEVKVAAAANVALHLTGQSDWAKVSELLDGVNDDIRQMSGRLAHAKDLLTLSQAECLLLLAQGRQEEALASALDAFGVLSQNWEGKPDAVLRQAQFLLHIAVMFWNSSKDAGIWEAAIVEMLQGVKDAKPVAVLGILDVMLYQCAAGGSEERGEVLAAICAVSDPADGSEKMFENWRTSALCRLAEIYAEAGCPVSENPCLFLLHEWLSQNRSQPKIVSLILAAYAQIARQRNLDDVPILESKFSDLLGVAKNIDIAGEFWAMIFFFHLINVCCAGDLESAVVRYYEEAAARCERRIEEPKFVFWYYQGTRNVFEYLSSKGNRDRALQFIDRYFSAILPCTDEVAQLSIGLLEELTRYSQENGFAGGTLYAIRMAQRLSDDFPHNEVVHKFASLFRVDRLSVKARESA